MMLALRMSLVLCLMLSSTASAGTYYLNAAAEAGGDGSEGKPWNSLDAMQESLAAKEGAGGGDEVLVAPGDYGRFTALAKGAARTDWLRVRAADAKKPPVFRGIHIYGVAKAYLSFEGLAVRSVRPHNSLGLVHLKDAGSIRLIDCELTCEDDRATSLLTAGVYTQGKVTDLTFERCRVHNTNTGLSVAAENLVVRGCEVYDLTSSGIQIFGDSPGALIENNYIHHQRPNIIRMTLFCENRHTFKADDEIVQPATGAKGRVRAATAEYVEVFPTRYDRVEFAIGKPIQAADGERITGPIKSVKVNGAHGSGLSLRSSGLTLRGNILHDFGSSAIVKLYDRPGAAYDNITFENNLVFDPINTGPTFSDLGEGNVFRNNTFICDVQLYAKAGKNLSGVTFTGNIATSVTSWTVEDLTSLKASHNVLGWLITRKPTYTVHTSYDAYADTLILGKPASGVDPFAALFANAAGHDFRLAEGSKAIGFADPKASPETDLGGNRRADKPNAGCFATAAKPVQISDPLNSATTQWYTKHKYEIPDLTDK